MILLTTGKGGVGKTTVAAATATALADEGHRTVVVSIDPAHSLGDVLDLDLSAGVVVPVCERLGAAEIRLAAELQERWGVIRDWLVRLMRSQGVDRWVAEDIAFLPGLEELVGLLRLVELDDEWDVVVVDCPPTGSTLRYLGLPEAAGWYMERFFPIERRLVQAVGPLAERLVGIPMPDAPVFDQVQSLFDVLGDLQRRFNDPGRTRAQVVTTPESVVLRETERAVGYLQLQEIPVARIVANRAGPRQAAAIGERFAPVGLVAAPACDEEPIGLAALRGFAARLFDGVGALPDPVARMPVQVTEIDGVARLHLALPRPKRARELKVGRRGDDLLLDWGPMRRHLPLPPSLAVRRMTRAGWDDDGLTVEFAQ